MDLSKRVSRWSLEDVLEWLQDQHPSQASTLQKAFIKHAISGTSHAPAPCGTADDGSGVHNLSAHSCPCTCASCPPGRALLRLRDHHLERLGLDTEEQLREIWQDLLLLRVQEEICELEDLHAGEEADLSPLHRSASRIQLRRKTATCRDCHRSLSLCSLSLSLLPRLFFFVTGSKHPPIKKAVIRSGDGWVYPGDG